MFLRKISRKRATGWWVALVWFAAFGITAPAAAAPDSTLTFFSKACQFRINDSLNLAEIYFAIPRGQLEFVADSAGLLAEVDLSVLISRDGKPLASRQWRLESFAGKAEDIKASQTLFSLSRFQMKSGVYDVDASATDSHSGKQGRQRFQLQVRPFIASELALSDIELASQIKRDDRVSLFEKNGYQVVPNPAALYGDGMPLLMSYAEIYNLRFPADTTYAITYRVYNAGGELVKTLPVKTRHKSGSALVEVGGFNVLSLRTGSYKLELEVCDHSTGAIARHQERFFVYRQNDRPARTTGNLSQRSFLALAPIYREMTQKQLDEEFDAARWIAKKEEITIYPQLDLEGKREFMAKFWAGRDSDSTTVRNEFRDDYLGRARYAVQNFSVLKPGWRTDRGRVLLIYGKPDEIERFPSSNDARAYEIWQYYEIEGGVQFVFVDIRGWGDFELVHSSVRAEINDSQWQRWLTPTN